MTPKLHLAVDNCFASKRWTEPAEWMRIAADAGIYCIEASADNECDPLYTPAESLTLWLKKVETETVRTGVRVVNLYSGHGTYATLGLAHNDPRVRDHIQHHWLEPMIRSAAALKAGLGFFCHAFPQKVMADPAAYTILKADLYRRLGELARYAQIYSLTSLSVEQMYSPHQIPWTIAGGEELVRDVSAGANAPIYLTLDTGHQVGQPRFQRPTADALLDYLEQLANGSGNGSTPEPWLGSVEVLAMARRFVAQSIPPGSVLREIEEAMDATPYLFAIPEDGDLYAWTRRLGAYSPIIHLQQTDGTASGHKPFTPQYNATGIVHPEKLFAALKQAYAAPEAAGMPPRVTDIYLTIEVFSGTAERPGDSLNNIRETAKYWRQFLPEDGMTLDQLPG